jgi:hypothetical protein
MTIVDGLVNKDIAMIFILIFLSVHRLIMLECLDEVRGGNIEGRVPRLPPGILDGLGGNVLFRRDNPTRDICTSTCWD